MSYLAPEICKRWGYATFGDHCEPGVPIYNECNSCICGLNGKVSGCTLMLCTGWRNVCRRWYEKSKDING